MATWQFGFFFISEDVARAHGITAGSLITEVQRDALIQWSTEPLSSEAVACLRQVLTTGKSWSEDLEVIGDLESTCITFLREQNVVIEVGARLDLRTISAEILTALLGFAAKSNCLLLTDDNKVLRPDLRELKDEIKMSTAYRFVKDPQRFLADIEDKGDGLNFR